MVLSLRNERCHIGSYQWKSHKLPSAVHGRNDFEKTLPLGGMLEISSTLEAEGTRDGIPITSPLTSQICIHYQRTLAAAPQAVWPVFWGRSI